MRLKITYSAILATSDGTQPALFFTEPGLALVKKFEIEETIKSISGITYAYVTVSDDHKNLIVAVTYVGDSDVETVVDKITEKLEEYFTSPGYDYDFNADHVEVITDETEDIDPWLFQRMVKPGEKVVMEVELTSDGEKKKDDLLKQIKDAIAKDKNNEVVEYRDVYYKDGSIVVVMMAKKEFAVPDGKVSLDVLNNLLQIGDVGIPQLVWWIVLSAIAVLVASWGLSKLVKTISINIEPVSSVLNYTLLIVSIIGVLIIIFVVLKFLK